MEKKGSPIKKREKNSRKDKTQRENNTVRRNESGKVEKNKKSEKWIIKNRIMRIRLSKENANEWKRKMRK